MSATLLVLQHIACEPPAAFEEELRSRGLDLVRVELDEGEAIPERDDFAAIVVMGGPMGAYEDDEHPWRARPAGRRRGRSRRFHAAARAPAVRVRLERIVRVPAHSIG
jgi:hypothetical protein